MADAQHLDLYIKKSGKKVSYLAEKCGMTRPTFNKRRKAPEKFNNIQTTILCEELNITDLLEREKIFC